VQHNTIRLAEVLAALSLATNLGAGRSMGFAMRACILGMRMAEELRLSEQEQAVYRQLPIWKERIKIAPTIPREMVLDKTYRFNKHKFDNLQVPMLLLLGGDSHPFFGSRLRCLPRRCPTVKSSYCRVSNISLWTPIQSCL